MIQKLSLTLGIAAIIIAVVSLSGTILLTSLNLNSTPQYTLTIETDSADTVSEIERICNSYFNDYLILDAKAIQYETTVTLDTANIIIVHIYKTDKNTVRKAAEKMFKDLPLKSITVEEGLTIAEYHRS